MSVETLESSLFLLFAQNDKGSAVFIVHNLWLLSLLSALLHSCARTTGTAFPNTIQTQITRHIRNDMKLDEE